MEPGGWRRAAAHQAPAHARGFFFAAGTAAYLLAGHRSDSSRRATVPFSWFGTPRRPHPRRRPAPMPRGFFAFNGRAPRACAPSSRHDAAHRDHRRLRGDAVRDARAIVDWLAAVSRQRLWADMAARCLLAAIPRQRRLLAVQTMLKHQSLAANFPMRLRWNFHRLMLGSSQHELLPGRVRGRVGEGHADALAGARHLDDLTDIPVVRDHLLRHHRPRWWAASTLAARLPRLAGACGWPLRWSSCRAWRLRRPRRPTRAR